MGLKHWILPNNQFKTHLFFPFLGGGTPFSLDLGPKGRLNFKSYENEQIYEQNIP